MLRLHQVRQTLGEVEVVDGVVAQRQVQHRVEGDGLDDPGGDIENEKFDFQLVMDKAAACHVQHLQMLFRLFV